jgi:hypothetical protein
MRACGSPQTSKAQKVPKFKKKIPRGKGGTFTISDAEMMNKDKASNEFIENLTRKMFLRRRAFSMQRR